MQRNFAIQVASHAAVSCASFSVALFAVELGASAWHVGVMGAAWGLAQLASSWTFGRAADVHGRRRIVQAGLAASALAVLLHVFAHDAWSLLAARALFGLAAGSFPAALTSLAFDENRKLGKFTGLGALGFSLGVLLGGFVSLAGHSAVFVASAALLAVGFAVSLAMRYPAEHPVHVPVFPREVIARNAPAYAAVVLRHAGAMGAWCVFPLFLASMGASLFELALANAVNGVSQFVFMSRMDRGRPATLVVVGCVASALAFAALLAAPSVAWAIAAQPVLALGWAMLYMGSLRLVLSRSVERATATGLLQSTVHFANVIGPPIGGLVAWRFGFEAAMALGVVGALAAIPVFLHEMRAHPDPVPAPGALPVARSARPE